MGKIEVDLCKLSHQTNQIDKLLVILTHECFHYWQAHQTLENKSNYEIINNSEDNIYVILSSLNEGFATFVSRQNLSDPSSAYDKYEPVIAFEKFNEFLNTPISKTDLENIKKNGLGNQSYFYFVPYEILSVIEKFLGIEVIKENIYSLDFFNIFYQYESLCIKNEKLLKINMEVLDRMIIRK